MSGSHVLMEKPVAHTMEDARALVNLCRKEGIKLKVGFAHRYRKEYQMAHELISSGGIGVPGMLVDILEALAAATSRLGVAEKIFWGWDCHLQRNSQY